MLSCLRGISADRPPNEPWDAHARTVPARPCPALPANPEAQQLCPLRAGSILGGSNRQPCLTDSLEASGFLSALAKAGLLKGSRSETGGSCSGAVWASGQRRSHPHLILAPQQCYRLQAEPKPHFTAEETEAQAPWQVDRAVKLNSRSCLRVPGPLLLPHCFVCKRLTDGCCKWVSDGDKGIIPLERNATRGTVKVAAA